MGVQDQIMLGTYQFCECLVSTKTSFVDPDNAKNELVISSLLINIYHEFLLSFNHC